MYKWYQSFLSIPYIKISAKLSTENLQMTSGGVFQQQVYEGNKHIRFLDLQYIECQEWYHSITTDWDVHKYRAAETHFECVLSGLDFFGTECCSVGAEDPWEEFILFA